MAVKFQQEYVNFIVERGVGANDVIASSPDSYLSHPRSVSTHISIDIDETTLCSEYDVQRLAAAIKGILAPSQERLCGASGFFARISNSSSSSLKAIPKHLQIRAHSNSLTISNEEIYACPLVLMLICLMMCAM